MADKEYIDRVALLDDLNAAMKNSGMGFVAGQTMNLYILNPAADVVEVVLCKDCKYSVDHHKNGYMRCMRPIHAEDYWDTGFVYPLEVTVREYGFCSYGERKEATP